MKKLWLFLEESALEEKNKNTVFIVISVTMANLLGAALWLLIGRLLLPGTEWLLCFMGYSGVFAGLIGSILYLYNHEFGRKERP